jgi:hypothetical protein
LLQLEDEAAADQPLKECKGNVEPPPTLNTATTSKFAQDAQDEPQTKIENKK